MSDEQMSREELLQENDLLRRRVTELESANPDEQYHDIFQFAGDSIFIIDPTTKDILDANNHAVRRFGYSYDELLNLSLTALELSEEAAKKRDTGISWRSVISGTVVYETTFQHKDRTYIPVEVSTRLVEKGDGYIRLNFVRDVTERNKIAEQKMEIHLERERVEILAKFIRQISHEFKTPLAVIETNTYLLEKKAISDKVQPHIQQITDQVANISQLVDDLLTMSRLDSGQPMAFDRISVNELLQVMREVIQQQTQEKNLQLRMELFHEPLWIPAHSEYLQQAFLHILDNAIRFTPQGGSIMIRSSLAQDHVLVEIMDTGYGITEDSLPRVLERFYREDHAGTTRGFGMGLPIADVIIKRHYGRLEVESEVGEGTLVRVLLPLKVAE